MDAELNQYIEKFAIEIQDRFQLLRELILRSVSGKVEEKLWAKLPSFYVGDRFIRIIPFKDHINIEATSIIEHKTDLSEFKITPKGMLQIYINQSIPCEVLQTIFKETLTN